MRLAKARVQQNFDKAYQKAKKQAAQETELPINTFPDEAPFTPEQTLDEDFLPE